jgi:hypothetical protein
MFFLSLVETKTPYAFMLTATTPLRFTMHHMEAPYHHTQEFLAPHPKSHRVDCKCILCFLFRATLDPEGKRSVLVSDGIPEPSLGYMF